LEKEIIGGDRHRPGERYFLKGVQEG